MGGEVQDCGEEDTDERERVATGWRATGRREGERSGSETARAVGERERVVRERVRAASCRGESEQEGKMGK